MTNIPTLIERLRSSAAAFRENSVFDSEGDEVRLTVQARECDEAAAMLKAAVDALRGAERAMTCNHVKDTACYCPNCGNSFCNARDKCRAALAQINGKEG